MARFAGVHSSEYMHSSSATFSDCMHTYLIVAQEKAAAGQGGGSEPANGESAVQCVLCLNTCLNTHSWLFRCALNGFPLPLLSELLTYPNDSEDRGCTVYYFTWESMLPLAVQENPLFVRSQTDDLLVRPCRA